MMGLCKIKSNTQKSETEEKTFSDKGRVFSNLEHIEFDELAEFVNGLKILAPVEANEVTNSLKKELWKMRIADPVSTTITIKGRHLTIYLG